MNQPLKNKVFISTRPAGRSDELTDLFKKAGAKVLEMPLIKIQAADLSDPKKKWLQNPEQFQWLVFTSPNGVSYFFEALSAISAKDQIPPSVQIAVIGTKTEMILNRYGYTASFVNPGNTGEDFAEAFGKKLSGQPNRPNVLLALGNLARNLIQDKLEKQANCTRINVYKTAAPDKVDKNILQIIQDGRYEMIIFTSPSGIQNFMEQIKNIDPEKLRIACIGEITSRAAVKAGIKPLVIAENPSAEGIVNSIITFYN